MVCHRNLASWQQLETLAKRYQNIHLSQLFAEDEQRFSRYSLELPQFLLDYSKQPIAADVQAALVKLCEEVDVAGWRQKMFSGVAINATEQRAVLHTALRGEGEFDFSVNGENVTDAVTAQLQRMAEFSECVRSGEWLGYTGQRIRDVVAIGVGGSHLGPQMVTDALSHLADGTLQMHYVSNVDGEQIKQVLAKVAVETTLFIIASKTFTTAETMANAQTARAWLVASAGEAAVDKHFVAVSSAVDKAVAFGIDANNIFAMWDWVGGRFSLWSTIGLPIALALGFGQFKALLAGAHSMDRHFQAAPLAQNAPVLLAMLTLWNTTFLQRPSQVILPYNQNLHMLPAYLQQAEMESNGKSVTMSGETVRYATSPLLWGMTGINGQHAFYQCLHQGTHIVPADFIVSAQATSAVGEHHDILLANCLAQSQAMMNGVSLQDVQRELSAKGWSAEKIAEIAPHKVHQGNRPSTTIVLNQLDAHSLGALIALYEHKIFVHGVLLNIFSFDQWGVELGKVLANKVQPALTGQADASHFDSSTRNLIAYLQRYR